MQQGIAVTAYDLDDDRHRMQLIMTVAELAQVACAKGDITGLPSLMNLAESAGITDIIHLAALRVPDCKANPALGARVNIVGTVNVFEVARRLSLKRVVYASSVATYGVRDECAGSLIQPDDA